MKIRAAQSAAVLILNLLLAPSAFSQLPPAPADPAAAGARWLNNGQVPKDAPFPKDGPLRDPRLGAGAAAPAPLQNLVSAQTEAIKALNKRIDELEARIKTLEARKP